MKMSIQRHGSRGRLHVVLISNGRSNDEYVCRDAFACGVAWRYDSVAWRLSALGTTGFHRLFRLVRYLHTRARRYLTFLRIRSPS